MTLTRFRIYLSLYGRSLAYVYRASKKTMLVLLLTIPLSALLPSVTIFIANQLINRIETLTSHELVFFLLVWAGVFLVNTLASPLTTLLQGQLTDALTYQLNHDLMAKSKALETLDYFENPAFYNDIQLLSSEASWRPVNLLVFGTSILSNGLLFGSMLLIFASFHPLIALLMLVALLPQGLIFYRMQQEAFEVLVSNSEASRQLDYYSQTLLSDRSIKDVRLYNLYDLFLNKYRSTFEGIRCKVQATRRKKFVLSLLALSATTILSVASFSYVIFQIKSGFLAVGAILLFATSMIYALNSMTHLITESSLLYDTLMYMDKFFNFLSLDSGAGPGEEELLARLETIEVKDLTFAYQGQTKQVLKHVSFKVEVGDKIAIVGENGAGKTTLVKLFCRFYDWQTGDILINGQSLKSLSPSQYRKHLALIFQDFARFDLTLRENVSLTDDQSKALDQSILEALHKSGLPELTEADLDQVLGKKFADGRDLSGGQWQKVALARAFYADAPLLILDEPTAALDARTEYQLFERFLQLTAGKTVFYITHRLASVKQADKVLVLKDGQVVGFDSHKNLMTSNAYYKELYTMQSSLYLTD